MMIKPIRDWRVLTKCFFLLFGFILAMLFFPEQKEEVPVSAGVEEIEVKNPVDFFSQFREDREQRRSEKIELYQGFLEDTAITEDEKKQILLDLETFYQRNALEDKIEAILIGRGYEDIIFSYEEGLSLLMIKGEELTETEKDSLIQFVQVYSGVPRENLSVFSIAK